MFLLAPGVVCVDFGSLFRGGHPIYQKISAFLVETGDLVDMTRNRRTRRNRAGIVSVVATESAPAGVLPVRVAGSTFPHHVVPPVTSAPVRPTSIVITIASSSVCSWKITCRSAGAETFESRSFLTAGNSVDVRLRNGKSADFALLVGSGGTANVRWTIESSGTGGQVVGVAYFSVKGEIDAASA